MSVVIAMPMMTSIFLSGKYFERRKRNNLAAKKSRDQRKVNIFKTLSFLYYFFPKVRESRVCQRATLLEKENAVLRAQVFYFFHKKNVINFCKRSEHSEMRLGH